MTELAYLPDLPSAYVRSFRARVTALPPGAVVLDRTYFYPAGGGQPCDRGSLELPDGTSLPVVDVVKSGGSVIHRVKALTAPARTVTVGVEVQGSIDWERRHRHMLGCCSAGRYRRDPLQPIPHARLGNEKLRLARVIFKLLP